MATFGRQRAEVFDRAAKAQYYRDNIAGLTAYERHTKLIQDALSYDSNAPSGASAAAGASASANAAAALAGTRTDADVLREGYRFIRDAADDVGGTWEVKLARKYYARLFKEYAIADLSRYKQGAIGLRWRTHAEVVSGKGQFMCGGRGCDEKRALASFEVPFGYKEAGQAKQALVKLRLCPRCAGKLSYKRGKEEQGLSKGRLEKQQREREEERQKGRVEKQQRERSQGRQKGRGGEEKEGGGERGSKRRRDGSADGEEGAGRKEREAAGGRSKRRRSGSEEAAAAAVQDEAAAEEAGQATRHERWPDGSANEAVAGRERRSKQRRGDSEGVEEGELQHASKERGKQRRGGSDGKAEVEQEAAQERSERRGTPDEPRRRRGSSGGAGDGAVAAASGDEAEFDQVLESMFAQM